MLCGLYAITDTKLTPARSIVQKVESALKGGAQLIQYRDKINPFDQKEIIALKLQGLCKQYRRKLIINDDLKLAHAINADGVHLGQEDASIDEARKLLGSNAIIGATCHDSLSLAHKAVAEGASYVAFGRFYCSTTKPGAPSCSIEFLKEARQSINIPIVAIGGITLKNAPAIIAEGADMIAMVHGVFGTENIEQQSQELGRLFN